MRQKRYALSMILLLAALLAVPGSALAQDSNFTVGIFGGVGGSPDSDSYTEPSFQLFGSMIWAPRTYAQVRVGQLDTTFELAGGSGTVDADLGYVTFGTEYRSNADYYQAGLVIGLGYYDLGGVGVFDDEAFGVFVGSTGDFSINPRWSVLVEVTGHYANFDEAQIFLMGHIGVAYRF